MAAAVGLMAFLPLAGRAPQYARLMLALIADDRTPATRKALLAGAAGYLLVGRDIIPDDIPILADFLVARLNERLKRRVVGITNPALRVLMSAPWRGNVRELDNVLERAMLLTNSDTIDLDDLPAEITGTSGPRDSSDDLRHAVRAYEREHIRHVLTATRGNREEASRRLGIDASTLYRRMRDLAI